MQFGQLQRRDFIALLGGAVSWPLAARAQQRERVRRIGLLMGFLDDAQGQIRITVLREELARLGWTEGHNAHIEVRWGGGDPQLTQTYAAELVRLKPDVIIANSSVGVSALLSETRTIPVDGTARRLRQRNGMSAIGGTAYVAAKLLTSDEAWRIAVNIARLPELLTKP